jgi:threonylcarbamoyladenosine tRNA methylthiotransferase MtaB
MRVAFTTLGCRLNQFETEGMRSRLSAHVPQSVVVDWETDADVYVINSCAVTARAEQKCRQLARAVKRGRPSARVMVVGCYSQLQDDVLARMPEVDGILGNEEKRQLEVYLPRLLENQPVREVGRYRRGQAMAEEWIDAFNGLSRAVLKVQEGCNLRCTFCAIWKARGPSRSRAPRDVVEQARHLAARGFEEVVLAGVHLGHYGRDLSTPASLNDLLDMLLEVVDERVRFRLSSIDPGEVDVALAHRLAREPRLCRYLHLPLQSGSDTVLRAMRRAYNRGYYERLIEQIHAVDPGFGLGSDVIVGFPGETDEDFAATYDLMERLPVSFYHVFPYSDRPGTSAAALENKVPGPVVAARSARLRKLGARKRQDFLRRQVGLRLEGVVESTREGSAREIMLDNYATVWAAADPSLEGRRVSVHVQALDPSGRLRGVVSSSSREEVAAS